jgi:mRNA-degrading endonuclease RelE of RelBE toxin-antitoxin system
MSYRLRVSKGVQREIARLPGHIRPRVQRVIAGLVTEPRPANADELRDDPSRSAPSAPHS